jgi:hypothetical protein
VGRYDQNERGYEQMQKNTRRYVRYGGYECPLYPLRSYRLSSYYLPLYRKVVTDVTLVATGAGGSNAVVTGRNGVKGLILWTV